MFRCFFYFLSDTAAILHQCTFTLAALPKEGDTLMMDNLPNPNHKGLVGKVQKVAFLLDAASSQEEVQKDFVVLAKILDYVEEDILTVFVQAKSVE